MRPVFLFSLLPSASALAGLALFSSLVPGVASAGPVFCPEPDRSLHVTAPSRQFDAHLVTTGPCRAAGADSCLAEARLMVTPRDGMPLPVLTLDSVRAQPSTHEDGRCALPVVDSVVFGDMDFDGYDDLAILRDSGGPYGSPTYAVYLYVPAQRRFVPHRALSALTEDYLGLFRRDPAKRQIEAAYRSGCCASGRVRFSVRGARLLPVERRSLEFDARTAQWIDTLERHERGRWRVLRRRRMPEPLAGQDN